MEITNNSFIITTIEGNKVVEIQSTTPYKDIKFIGNGFYDWGKEFNQNFAIIIDKISSLESGGIEQAVFDANQFIEQFQDSQAVVLEEHRQNLLNSIDIAINNKFNNYQDSTNNKISEIEIQLSGLATNNTEQLEILKTELLEHISFGDNDIYTQLNDKIETYLGSTGSITVFKNEIEQWKENITPKIENFTTSFEIFKDNTNIRFSNTDNQITELSNNLSLEIEKQTTNFDTQLTLLQNSIETETNNKVSNLENLFNTTVNELTASNNNLLNEITELIETETTELKNYSENTYVKNSNTILADSKSYTDQKIDEKFNTDSEYNSIKNQIIDLSNNFDSKVYNYINPRLSELDAPNTGRVSIIESNLSIFNNNINGSLTDLSNNLIITKTDLQAKIDNIYSLHPITWEEYTDNKFNTLNNELINHNNRLNNTDDKLFTHDTTLLDINGNINNIVLDITSLKDRTYVLENKDTVSSVQLQNSVDILEQNITDQMTNGYYDKGTIDIKLNNIVGEYISYTDNSVQGIYTSLLNDLNTQLENIENNTIIPMQNSISELQVQQAELNNKIDTNIEDLTSKYIDPITSKLNILNMDISFIKENFVTFDTIYPIIGKLLGFVNDNKITTEEIYQIIDGIILKYKDESNEIEKSNIYVHYSFDGGLKIKQVSLNKDTFKIVNSIIITDGNNSITINNFKSNDNINNTELVNGNLTINEYLYKNYILVDTNIDISSWNIENLKYLINYENELDYSVKLNYIQPPKELEFNNAYLDMNDNIINENDIFFSFNYNFSKSVTSYDIDILDINNVSYKERISINDNDKNLTFSINELELNIALLNECYIKIKDLDDLSGSTEKVFQFNLKYLMKYSFSKFY